MFKFSKNQFPACRTTSAFVQRSDSSWKPAFEGFNDARLAEVVEASGRNSSGSSVSATATRTDTTESACSSSVVNQTRIENAGG